MIILLSKDFRSFALALQDLYAEPGLECLEQSKWQHDLTADNDGKFISRLSIIGHSDSFYGEDQSFFGGNLHERVMQMDEFVHSLINLLKYNERRNPGFCKHLKHIDIIDCHISEKKFVAPIVAEYFHDDEYLREYGAHITISSFANSHHPKAGTVLMPHPLQSNTLSFYTFDSAKAFNQFQKVHHELAELESDHHNLQQMPGHTVLLSNGQSRDETSDLLEKQCEDLRKKESIILKNNTHKVQHISDPRDYLDNHTACQVRVAEAKSHPRHHHVPHKYSKAPLKKSTRSAHSPQFFGQKPAYSHPKHTSYLEGNTLHTTKRAGVEEEFVASIHKKFQ